MDSPKQPELEPSKEKLSKQDVLESPKQPELDIKEKPSKEKLSKQEQQEFGKEKPKPQQEPTKEKPQQESLASYLAAFEKPEVPLFQELIYDLISEIRKYRKYWKDRRERHWKARQER